MSLHDAAFWTLHVLWSRHVVLQGLIIRGSMDFPNNDGRDGGLLSVGRGGGLRQGAWGRRLLRQGSPVRELRPRWEPGTAEHAEWLMAARPGVCDQGY